MELVIWRIDFHTEEINFADEQKYGVWSGIRQEVPAYETNVITIDGKLIDNKEEMTIKVSYAYEDFKELTIGQVREEVTRRIIQSFADKKEFKERVRNVIQKREEKTAEFPDK